MIDETTQQMSHIRQKWGAIITEACKLSSVPEAFLAALIGNESGGDENAKRFEHGVFASLWEVLESRKASFGSIGLEDVLRYTLPPDAIAEAAAGTVRSLYTAALERLDGLATSWGLTQIMGYEAIAFGVPISDLHIPLLSLRISLRMISQFAGHNNLDVTKDFPELFDCWNTGRPHAATADPSYIPNGLHRLNAYMLLSPPDDKAISA